MNQEDSLREFGLRFGDVVVLKGLKKEVFQFLNGKRGVIVGYRECPEPNGQILVKLHNSDAKQAYAMRPANVALLHRMEDQPIHRKNRVRDQHHVTNTTFPNTTVVTTSSSAQSILQEIDECIDTIDAIPGDSILDRSQRPRLTRGSIERLCWYLVIFVTISLTLFTSLSSVQSQGHRWNPTWKNSTVQKVFDDAADNIDVLLLDHTNVALAVTDAREILSQFVPISRRRIDDLFTTGSDCRWVQTGWCTPYGPAPIRIKFCHEEVTGVTAGFCQCGDERFLGKPCTRTSQPFTCNAICFPNKKAPQFPTVKQLQDTAADAKATAVVVSISLEGKGEQLGSSFRSFEYAANRDLKLPYVVFEPPVLPGIVPRPQEDIDMQRKQISSSVSTTVSFTAISVDCWAVPNFVNKSRIHLVKKKHVREMTSMTFRRIARFYTLFLHRDDSVKDFDYIWRIPSDTLFLCKLNYDPVGLLSSIKKQVGFTMVEWAPQAAATDFQHFVTEWIGRKGLVNSSFYNRVTNNRSELGGCQFHTSSLIMSTSFLNSKNYNLLVSSVDRKGGIFYNRWSEALIQSFAIYSLLGASDVFYLESSAVATPSIYHVPLQNSSCGSDAPHQFTSLSNNYNVPCVEMFADLARLPS
eukprot:TRINITY_DN2855_c2_g1_i1.p1 TRINITY_DN2855_c2_g1~~TRINITY_DN2855_c2_g1_i1.p1  ORF type:complete len:638 (+),score=71.04 TRINITY_DN2855_c2_g1_i1:75-1988(+)